MCNYVCIYYNCTEYTHRKWVYAKEEVFIRQICFVLLSYMGYTLSMKHAFKRVTMNHKTKKNGS